MTMATDVSAAVATALMAVASVATQVALLETYRLSDPKSFYDNGGHAAGSIREQWRSSVDAPLQSMIRG